MKVYSSGRLSTRFHVTPDCTAIKDTKYPYVETDLKDVGSARPCAFCVPDYPRAKVVHARCKVCNKGKPHPCSHNGGVLVVCPGKATRLIYVWPEHAHMYEVAELAARL